MHAYAQRVLREPQIIVPSAQQQPVHASARPSRLNKGRAAAVVPFFLVPQQPHRAASMKVSVKWGKELYKDVEVDTSQPPMVFKSQLFTLSGVPPDRQKVLIKGGQLKDDEWGKQQPKEGMTIMMMGSADEVKVDAPVNMPKFVEDLPEEEQNTLATKAYGSGLKNLGNTCYMNSTVQCLYSIQGLRDAVLGFNPSTAAAAAAASSLAGPSTDSGKKLVLATQELFQDLKKGGEPFPPFKFLLMLRQRFPQFAQQTNEGFYMQQDAEECWTNIMYTLKEGLKVRAAFSGRCCAVLC